MVFGLVPSLDLILKLMVQAISRLCLRLLFGVHSKLSGSQTQELRGWNQQYEKFYFLGVPDHF